jgi:predicted GIY-YIG superfamily endonuclease
MDKKAIVYGIRCRANNRVYIGSTFDPRERFRNHLVMGFNSNLPLQVDIRRYGLR